MSVPKVSQNLFLQVKEKLDYYHLPSSFPIEATHLISKLLTLVNSSNNQEVQNTPKIEVSEGVSAAIRHQMGLIVKQNNKLHLDLMTARQEIQSLSNTIHKFQSNRNSKDKEMNTLSALKSQRQTELVEQLRQLRYKYNQLMDFLHEDPKADRQYIKRLMKHKHYQVKVRENEEPSSVVPNPIQHQNSFTANQRIKQLQGKVKNRQTEILRLQKVLQYDGLNLNKIIKNFNEELVKNRLKNADSKINYLEESLDKTRKQNTNMRNKNGLRQALRSEVQKCHKIIHDVKEQNQKLRRNADQQQFDIQKRTKQNDRKVDRINGQKHHADQVIKQHQNQIKQLNKKICFLEKEQKQGQKVIQSTKGQLESSQNQNKTLSSKNQELKLYYEYEIQTFRRKISELQFQIGQSKSINNKLFGENDLFRKQNSLKTQSIFNLEKIVNELMKKNSLLNDGTGIKIQQYSYKNEQIQTRRHLAQLQQQLISSQTERQQLYSDLRTIQHRFAILVKENEQNKIQLGRLANQLITRDGVIIKNAAEIDEFKFAVKKSNNEHYRQVQSLKDNLTRRQALNGELKADNEKLIEQEKRLRNRTKELDIRVGQVQAILEVNNLRLAEREERVRNLEKLLKQSVQNGKRLAQQLSQLTEANHSLSRQNHRTNTKYQELLKQSQDFKSKSFKNYQVAINDNLNEVSELKIQLHNLKQTEYRTNIKYQESISLLNIIRREKELTEVDKLSLERDYDHLRLRLEEMQEIQRNLVIQNQNLRNSLKNH